MSKVDAQRAMREAKWAALPPRVPTVKVTPPPVRPAEAGEGARASSEPNPPAEHELVIEASCGHRNIGGRTCQRPSGHAEKSHRYS